MMLRWRNIVPSASHAQPHHYKGWRCYGRAAAEHLHVSEDEYPLAANTAATLLFLKSQRR